MIIIRVRGGLGNQLFSYARGFALAKDQNTKLLLDNYIYETSYSLRRFNLLDYKLSYSDLFIKRFPAKNLIRIFILKVWNRFKWQVLYRCDYIKEQKDFEYLDINIKHNKNLYLNGYWQVHAYFDIYRENLKQEFQLKSKSDALLAEAKEIEQNHYCAIHVRHGDYKTFKGGKCLSIKYYKDSIEIMNRKFPEIKYMFFSDDIEFCKNEFNYLKNVSFCEYGKWTDEEELFLMSCCKHFIIANSTFSWWAAYLSTNINPVVICPVVDMWRKSFYLDDWMKIDAELVNFDEAKYEDK